MVTCDCHFTRPKRAIGRWRPYMAFIVGFLVRRSGGWETLRSRFRRPLMRTSTRHFPWIVLVIGATSWFAMWAVYSQMVLA